VCKPRQGLELFGFQDFRTRTSFALLRRFHSAILTDGVGERRVEPCHPMRRAVCDRASGSDIVSVAMYENFTAVDRWSKKQVHCIYQALIAAISTRHADAIDIKFLVDGRPVWVALPHPAWVEYKNRTGRTITDPLAVEIAGHYLMTALKSGEGVGREMYSLTVAETLAHLEAVVAQAEPEAVPQT
jgi:hypothetical protein